MNTFKRFLSFSKSINFNLLLFGILIVMLLSAGIGCNSGSDGDSGTKQESSEESPELQASAFLAVAASPADSPVANALIEELGTSTSSQGIAAGPSSPEPDKWYKIKAIGYAPDYIQAAGSLEGTLMFESVLTPVDSREFHNPGTPTVIQDDPSGPFVQITVPEDVFAEDVFLELTGIEPLHLGPLFAETDSGESLYPQLAFSIEAYDINGKEAPFMAGRTARVFLTDNGVLGDSPVLAWFNPENGSWEELDSTSYFRVDENTIQANLNHFSTYAGMGSNVPQGQGYDGARADLRKEINEWAEEGGGVPPRDVLDALDHLAREAMDFADANYNEIGKQRLFSVMAQAQLLGQEHVSNQMWQKTVDITQSIAEELINDPNCGRLREMMGCMAQCQILALDGEAAELYAKIQDLLNVCSNWHGTVKYIMDIQDPHNIDPDYSKENGPSTWTELHEVVLSINPENYAITGDDLVTLIAPEVVYRADGDSGDCTGDTYDELKHAADPENGDLFLIVDGAFQPGDRPVFSLETPVKGPASNNISMLFTQYSQWFDSECNLQVLGPEQIEFPYNSMLVDQQPPITLQEMLNSGFYFNHGDCEIIKGYKKLTLDGSTFGMQPMPFNSFAVQWHFVQVKPPLK